MAIAVVGTVAGGTALTWQLVGRGVRPRSGVVAPVAVEPGRVGLPPAAAHNNPIAIATAQPTRVVGDIQLVGTVGFHEDHYAVVGPLVAGRVSRLCAGVGDRVKRGEVIAEIESAEVGQARAELLAASARLAAAEANLRRESELADRKISSERERELAQAQSATERANVRAAAMRLRAIGLSKSDVNQTGTLGGFLELPATTPLGRAQLRQRDQVSRRDVAGAVAMRAPIDGTIIERKVTLGQAVERATDAFTIADTSHVWVTLDLYEKDLFRVSVGQPVELLTESRPGETFRGRVGFIVPVIDPATRTAKVRLEFPNPNGALQSGQLVTARIRGEAGRVGSEVLAVPRSAVEQVDGKTVVFVENSGGFERRDVLTGRSGGEHVEIREGLHPGERVAAQGAFLLKSELLR
ncbi:MAG TPA: efflux RND transporter periplasmic adaptor subunit [Polyangia bacterium]|nr:efflux RND transporter periplasmic adaptor subunit [Polyangia bacterium]